MNYKTVLFFIAITMTICAGICLPVVAASVTLSPSLQQQGTVTVLLSPEGEIINSFDITIHFPSDILSFDGYVDHGVVPIWVQKPAVTEKGVLQLAGVIPGGIVRAYDPNHPDRDALSIVSLRFSSSQEIISEGTITVSSATLLRNDGKGSVVATSVESATIQTAPIQHSSNTDTVAPTTPVLSLIEKSKFGRTPRMLAFTSSDEESGIEYYEVSSNGHSFLKTESPFPLPKRLFSYTVTVRAFDFAGNSAEKSIQIQETPLLGIVLLLILGGAGIVMYKRSRKRRLPL